MFAIPATRRPRAVPGKVATAISEVKYFGTKAAPLTHGKNSIRSSYHNKMDIRFTDYVAFRCRPCPPSEWPTHSATNASGSRGQTTPSRGALTCWSSTDDTHFVRMFLARLVGCVLDPIDLFFERRTCWSLERVIRAFWLDDLCRQSLVDSVEQMGSSAPQDRTLESARMWQYMLQTILHWHVSAAVDSPTPLIGVSTSEHAVLPAAPTIIQRQSSYASSAPTEFLDVTPPLSPVGDLCDAPTSSPVVLDAFQDIHQEDEDACELADLHESRMMRTLSCHGISTRADMKEDNKERQYQSQGVQSRVDHLDVDLEADLDWHMSLLDGEPFEMIAESTSSCSEGSTSPAFASFSETGASPLSALSVSQELSMSMSMSISATRVMTASGSWVRSSVWNTDLSLKLEHGVVGLNAQQLSNEVARSPRALALIRAASLKLAALWLHFFPDFAMSKSSSVHERMIGGSLGAYVVPGLETAADRQQRQAYILLEPLLGNEIVGLGSSSTAVLVPQYRAAHCRCCVSFCLRQVLSVHASGLIGSRAVFHEIMGLLYV
jgi:hypothetical protein